MENISIIVFTSKLSTQIVMKPGGGGGTQISNGCGFETRNSVFYQNLTFCKFVTHTDLNRGGLYRGEKRVMFQISEVSSLFDAEWSPEQFDTIFNEIGQKSRRCRPKNRCGLGGAQKI